MRIDTLLKKEKDGSFYKTALVAVEAEKKKPAKQDVDEFMKHVNDYLLMTTPKTAAAYWRDKLPGGLADKKKPEDFDQKELAAGEKVEAEHTSDPKLRREIAMDHLREFPRGYYSALREMEQKLEKKSGLDRSTSLSISTTGSEKEWGGPPVSSKKKRGDAPTADGSEGIDSAGVPTWQPPQSAIAPKVAGLHPLVPSSNTMPTLDDDRVPTRMNRLRDEPFLSVASNAALENQRTDATAKLAHQFLIRLQMEKIASDLNLSEMEKEAILQQLRAAAGGVREVGRALVGAPVRLQVGDEVVHVAGNRLLPKIPSYKDVGQGLHHMGERLKGPAGMLPEEAKAMGFHTSAGSRIAGEAASSAGHHMAHASTAGKLMNPLGKPIGGAIEGLARGTGKELVHASGAVSTGLEGAGRSTIGGGVLGQAGRHLQQAAPHLGTVGEIAGAAGTATGLGAAVSPAAAGLAAGLKGLGVYAPLKAHLGLGALNVAKDALAHGAEKGIEHGMRLVRGRAA